MKKKLLYVINHLRMGAVPNILLEIIPYITSTSSYDVKLLSLQKVEDPYLIDKLKTYSIEYDDLGLKRRDVLYIYPKLKKYFKVHRPDIIHSNLGRADIFSSICKNKDSKLITTFHSVRSNYNFFTRLGYTLTDNRVSMRTAVSNSVKKSWEEKGYLRKDIRTVYNPVSISQNITPIQMQILKEELNISENDILITNVGNIRKQKGQIYLIKALKILINKYPNIKLLIAGRPGDAYEELVEEINKLELKEYVYLVGFRNDISSILSISDVFVFPSKTEGLGISVLEAMASKVPVVASNIESIAEYLIDGKDGLLFKYNDVEEIAKQIEKILDNPIIAKELVGNAFTKINNIFNSKVIAEQYLDLYDKLTINDDRLLEIKK
ncbi:MAG: glycosyltransferase family 4 protein [Mollicutes bacterium]|nr:glycosyltransferase family 4 protein [Mollicutes bacterium]